MVPTLPAKDINLEDLQAYFGLQANADPNFFPEWRDNLPSLTEKERQALERIRSNYFNLATRSAFLEVAVKMVVLSPLLDLAGFYQPPFSIETEAPIEISAKDEDSLVSGNIDVLVIQKQLWVLVIESKSTKFDVMTALPQSLAYMLNDTKGDKPRFGLLLNGREFVFVKLVQQDMTQYARSYALSMEREHELEQVLGSLKRIGQLLIR